MSDTFDSLSFYDRSGLGFGWREDAACKGMDVDMFYPERGKNGREAIAVCAGCIVVKDCLHYALSNGIKYGIWGGKSERQRRVMRRENKLI
jgi:WhiB family redox-sensing transcriptional regulator